MKTLALGSLADLDNGKVNMAVNQAIRRCGNDCADRPGDSRKRTLTIKVDFVPVLEVDSGVLDVVNVGFKIDTKLPADQSTEYPMTPSPGGLMEFNPASPHDPRQYTLDGLRRPAEAAEADTPTNEDASL